MGKDPDRIREEIEQTRAELDDNRPADAIREEIRETRSQIDETVDALGHKADVKTRMREAVGRKKDAVVGTVSSGRHAVVGRADALVSSVTGVVPDTQQMKQGAAKVGMKRQNPIGLLAGGAAFGFLVGLVIPSTRVEDEKIGETADQLKETVKETGQEALERGKQVAQEAVGTAKDAASESAREQGQGMAESLKESAREVAPTEGAPQRG